MNKTWDEIKDLKSGDTIHDEYREGIRFIVLRGPSSLCAYVGVPESHPLAGFDYDDMPSIDCHGGLTFSSAGKDRWPTGWWWYGWDYSHGGDYSFYYDDTPLARADDRKWLLDDVIKDSECAIDEFIKFCRFAERIKAKP